MHGTGIKDTDFLPHDFPTTENATSCDDDMAHLRLRLNDREFIKRRHLLRSGLSTSQIATLRGYLPREELN